MELKVWREEAKKQGKTIEEAMEAYRRSGQMKKRTDAPNATKSLVAHVPGMNGMESSIAEDETSIELEITR